MLFFRYYKGCMLICSKTWNFILVFHIVIFKYNLQPALVKQDLISSTFFRVRKNERAGKRVLITSGRTITTWSFRYWYFKILTIEDIFWFFPSSNTWVGFDWALLEKEAYSKFEGKSLFKQITQVSVNASQCSSILLSL